MNDSASACANNNTGLSLISSSVFNCVRNWVTLFKTFNGLYGGGGGASGGGHGQSFYFDLQASSMMQIRIAEGEKFGDIAL